MSNRPLFTLSLSDSPGNMFYLVNGGRGISEVAYLETYLQHLPVAATHQNMIRLPRMVGIPSAGTGTDGFQ
ncbi:hypothetical protein Mapa_000575 [Marchantia paleacea]|nr:hypothetical protein Mapa_000575 [Marchantia paleacea]